jgi:hypothetical protein
VVLPFTFATRLSRHLHRYTTVSLRFLPQCTSIHTLRDMSKNRRGNRQKRLRKGEKRGEKGRSSGFPPQHHHVERLCNRFSSPFPPLSAGFLHGFLAMPLHKQHMCHGERHVVLAIAFKRKKKEEKSVWG